MVSINLLSLCLLRFLLSSLNVPLDTNSRVRCPMKGRYKAKINALDVGAKTKMEIDQEPCQFNVSINVCLQRMHQ